MSVALSLGKVTLWPKAATTALVQFLDTVQDLVDAGETVAVFDFSDSSQMTVERNGTGGAPSNGGNVGQITSSQGDATYTATAPADSQRGTWNSAGYLALDGVDDGYDLGVTPADNMTLVFAIKTSDATIALGDDYLNASDRILLAVQDGSSSSSLSLNSGSPSYRVNGIDQSWTTRDTVHSAVATGAEVIVTVHNADLSGWADLNLSMYEFGWQLDGNIHAILIGTNLTTEQIEIFEARAASIAGVTI